MRALVSAALCVAALILSVDVPASEFAACFPDAVRLCAVAPNAKADGVGFAERLRVKFCMLGHRISGDLSPRCAAVFRAHGL